MIKTSKAAMIPFEVEGGAAEGGWFQTLLIQWHFITPAEPYHTLIYFDWDMYNIWQTLSEICKCRTYIMMSVI